MSSSQHDINLEIDREIQRLTTSDYDDIPSTPPFSISPSLSSPLSPIVLSPLSIFSHASPVSPRSSDQVHLPSFDFSSFLNQYPPDTSGLDDAVLRDRYSSLRAKYHRDMNDMRSRLNQVSAELDTAVKDLAKKDEEMQAHRRQALTLNQLKSKNKNISQELEKLKSRLPEIEEQALSQFRRKESQLLSKLRSCEGRLADWKDRWDEAQPTIERVTELEEECLSLSKDNNRLHADLTNANAALEDMQRSVAGLGSTNRFLQEQVEVLRTPRTEEKTLIIEVDRLERRPSPHYTNPSIHNRDDQGGSFRRHLSPFASLASELEQAIEARLTPRIRQEAENENMAILSPRTGQSPPVQRLGHTTTPTPAPAPTPATPSSPSSQPQSTDISFSVSPPSLNSSLDAQPRPSLISSAGLLPSPILRTPSDSSSSSSTSLTPLTPASPTFEPPNHTPSEKTTSFSSAPVLDSPSDLPSSLSSFNSTPSTPPLPTTPEQARVRSSDPRRTGTLVGDMKVLKSSPSHMRSFSMPRLNLEKLNVLTPPPAPIPFPFTPPIIHPPPHNNNTIKELAHHPTSALPPSRPEPPKYSSLAPSSALVPYISPPDQAIPSPSVPSSAVVDDKGHAMRPSPEPVAPTHIAPVKPKTADAATMTEEPSKPAPLPDERREWLENEASRLMARASVVADMLADLNSLKQQRGYRHHYNYQRQAPDWAVKPLAKAMHTLGREEDQAPGPSLRPRVIPPTTLARPYQPPGLLGLMLGAISNIPKATSKIVWPTRTDMEDETLPPL
eukprot:TRINITY_DN2346_c0_g1_i2.p1 TRINITY_DN2346_c0_g1~~TRINITY_DN2346_c0_g1_i2.p1  ORF type:complete len:784 (-),score=152.50 TRINITY_DN2346_c0_g1_i2:10-2361(-)